MQAKIVLIGEGTVGKSTIRERYLGIAFREAYLQTVGADYTMKKETLEGGESLQLQIWDLAGQQGFYNIRDSFYKGADGIVLIFDVSQPKTVDGISNWVKEAKKNSSGKVPIVLVGNKIDLRKNGSISYEEGLMIAKKVAREQKANITYIESSAKTGEHIDEIFSTIASLIVERKNGKTKKVKDPNFTTYYNEVKDYIQLYFFKMLDDGPACVSQTSSLNDPELLIKMAIYYATALGQGSVANTGLFGPFPLPGSSAEETESNNQSLVYSFVKTDRASKDERMKRINFCFIVITIDKNLMYQFNNDNSIYRFFFNEIEEIEDVNDITPDFIYQLKENLLNNVFILNNPS